MHSRTQPPPEPVDSLSEGATPLFLKRLEHKDSVEDVSSLGICSFCSNRHAPSLMPLRVGWGRPRAHEFVRALWTTTRSMSPDGTAREGSTTLCCRTAPPANRLETAVFGQRRAASVPDPAEVGPDWLSEHTSPAVTSWGGHPNEQGHRCSRTIASTSSTDEVIETRTSLARPSGYEPECAVLAPSTRIDGCVPGQLTCGPCNARARDALFVQIPQALQRGWPRVLPTIDTSPTAQPATYRRTI